MTKLQKEKREDFTYEAYKEIIIIIIGISISFSLMTSAFAAEMESNTLATTESQKVSDELLEVLNISYSDLVAGDFTDNGDVYSCIIWINDIDKEEAVKAGIDAAEKTRDAYTTVSNYNYPYTVMEVNGKEVVEVELDETEDDEYVEAYIEAERAVASEMYEIQNKRFVTENLGLSADTDSIFSLNSFERENIFETESDGIATINYISSYSPCIFADLSITRIASLIVKEDVQRIGYVKNESGEDLDSTGFSSSELDDLQTHYEIIAADRARSIYGVSGTGIRIGQYETGTPDNSNVIKRTGYTSTSSHASQVYTIMNKVAPNAQYYATCRQQNSTNAETDLYSGIEWLLDQGVNIINISYGWRADTDLNQYDERAQWLDHITYNHDVHVVVAAGNNGSSGINSPAMAYNVISVGCVGMASPYNRISGSSYNSSGAGTNRTYKPDIVAPGYYESSSSWGTSYATPLVAATIALICEYRPALKTRQHIVKAILAASTSKNKRYVTIDNSNTSPNDNFLSCGAGLLDARAALWVISQGNYSQTTGRLTASGTYATYNMEVTSSDTSMRVALAYAKRHEFPSDSGHASSTPNMGTMGRLSLIVVSPSGRTYTCSTAEANLKVLQFTPAEYGTYTIKVRMDANSSCGSVNFGVAWR